MTPSDSAAAVTAAQVRLRVALAQARFDDALAIGSEAADEFGRAHPEETSTMLVEAATGAVYRANLQAAQSFVERGVELGGHGPVQTDLTGVGRAGVLAVQGEYREARDLLSIVLDFVRLLASEQAHQTADLLLGHPYRLQIGGWLAWQLFELDELNLADLLCAEVMHRVPASGVLTVMPYALIVRASIAMRRGDWTLGRSSTARALELAQEVGLPLETEESLRRSLP